MTRSHRRHLSLLLSTVMLLMMVCQGMALAAQPVVPAMTEMSVMNCHTGTADTEQVSINCHSECQQQAKATKSGKPIQLPALVPLLLCTLPSIETDTSPLRLTTLSSHDPLSDPPPLLRFQRFRE